MFEFIFVYLKGFNNEKWVVRIFMLKNNVRNLFVLGFGKVCYYYIINMLGFFFEIRNNKMWL